MDGISILVDLVVGRSKRARKNTATILLNLVKSNGDKVVGDVKEVDGMKATVRALVNGDSEVSTKGKSKAKMLLSILESKLGSQL